MLFLSRFTTGVKPQSANRGATPQPRRTVSVLIGSLALAAFSLPAAAINKCVDSAGNVTFSDRPCEQGSAAEQVEVKTRSGEPRLSGSSEAAMKASMEKVKASLPPEKREELGPAVLALMIAEMALHPEMSKEQIKPMVERKLRGKTGQEILDMAAAIKNDPEVQKALRSE